MHKMSSVDVYFFVRPVMLLQLFVSVLLYTSDVVTFAKFNLVYLIMFVN